MINCSVCGFMVNDLMKFALMQNSCPACGNSLFSDRDNYLIQTIQTKIENERFSSKLTKEIKYDLALFFFHELTNGLGKEFANHTTTVNTQEYFEESDDEDFKQKLKNEIASEHLDYLKQLEESDNDSDDIESRVLEPGMLDRVDRLKKIYKSKQEGDKKFNLSSKKPSRGIKRSD